MKIVAGLLLAGAVSFLVPMPTAHAQSKEAEVKQDQVKEAAREAEREGIIVDVTSGAPIAGAIVTAGDKAVRTDTQGRYRAAAGTQPLQVRAAGYGRATIAVSDAGPPTTKLTPLLPKALYLTVYGIGAPFLRDPALEVIDKSGLNALVIDLKGDRGLIPYPSKLPVAAKIGAQKLRTIPDLKELATTLKAKGIYLIGRVVVFKDDLLATAHPEWAIRAGGGLWKDREGLAWIDPSRKEAWEFPSASPRKPPPRASTRSSSTTSASRRRRPRLRQCVRRERARGGDHRLPARGAQAAGALQRVPGDGFLRLCLLERERHRHRPEGRGPGHGGRHHLAHALSVGLPVRHPRLPQSGRTSLRDRLQVARGVQTADDQLGGAIQALAAGVHRLCLWRKDLRRR